MALTEKCPACGAPVEVNEVEGGTLRCGFCSTELQMQDVGGELHLVVAGMPSPQSEVLTDKAHEVLSEEETSVSSEDAFARVFGDVESGGPNVIEPDADDIRTSSEREPDIFTASFMGESMPEPPGVGDEGQVAPGWATSASSMADINDWLPENRDTTTSTPPITIPETPAYQAGREAVPAARSNTGRWIAIGAAVIVGLCVTCACVVGAFLAVTNGGNF